MNCFSCKKDCVMKTEKYMDVTPCMACVKGEDMPTMECWECIKMKDGCNFVEKTT